MTASDRWGERAACLDLDLDPELFHAKTSHGQLHAISTWCLRCPVRADCLADALDLPSDQDYGVRGGLTALQRRALRKRPSLPTGRSAATVTALRQLLDEEQPNYRATPLPAPRPRRRARKEKTAVYEKPEPTPSAVEPEPTAEEHPVDERPAITIEPEPHDGVHTISDMLNWAAQHSDAAIRRHAGHARTALTAIQQRHAADTELERVLREAAQLRDKLGKLDARAKALKAPAPRAKAQRDYNPAEVRAWAKVRGMACRPAGQIPKAVLDAWREHAA